MRRIIAHSPPGRNIHKNQITKGFSLPAPPISAIIRSCGEGGIWIFAICEDIVPPFGGYLLVIFDRVKLLLRDESGATAIEYGLIAGLISLAIVAGASEVGNSVGNSLNNVSNAFQ